MNVKYISCHINKNSDIIKLHYCIRNINKYKKIKNTQDWNVCKLIIIAVKRSGLKHLHFNIHSESFHVVLQLTCKVFSKINSILYSTSKLLVYGNCKKVLPQFPHCTIFNTLYKGKWIDKLIYLTVKGKNNSQLRLIKSVNNLLGDELIC